MEYYKNLEIYQSAFQLAIKVYRMNVSLPLHTLRNQGNKMRRISLQIKDLIAEAYSGRKSTEYQLNILKEVSKQSQEMVLLLKKVNPTGNFRLEELIKNYLKLQHKAEQMQKELNGKNEYVINFPESQVMEMAG